MVEISCEEQKCEAGEQGLQSSGEDSIPHVPAPEGPDFIS